MIKSFVSSHGSAWVLFSFHIDNLEFFRKLLGNYVIWNFPKTFNNLCMEYLKIITISNVP